MLYCIYRNKEEGNEMKEFTYRIKLSNGMITEATVTAVSPGVAKQMLEHQYGRGSVHGLIR